MTVGGPRRNGTQTLGTARRAVRAPGAHSPRASLPAMDEMSGTLTCIVPRKVRAAAIGHRFQSWASLDLPSLAVARMTVVPLNADEGRRWRRLVKTEGGRDG